MDKWKKPEQSTLDLYESISNQLTDIEKRKMFGYPCAFIKGNMFFGVFENDLFIRVSADHKAELMANNGFTQLAPMGRPMKEYLVIPVEVRINNTELINLVKQSLAFASGLTPKSRKK